MNKKFTDILSVCVLILYLFIVARMYRNNIVMYYVKIIKKYIDI